MGAIGLPPPAPSKEELLGRRKGKLTEEEIEAAKQRRAEEVKARLQRQKDLEAELEAAKKNPDAKKKQAEIDADLRANYYFPTARKRYLPRIRDANEDISAVGGQITSGDWAKVLAFANGAGEEAKLPLQLYASSLAGQGLSLEVSYVKVMTKQAEVYAKELVTLKAAATAKDTAKAQGALERLNDALQTYRKAAKIDTPDGGVGEIPTGKAVGSSFLNNNPNAYNKRKAAPTAATSP